MAKTVDTDLLLDLYRRMLVIRGVEDRVQALFLRGEVYGTTHLYSGQEAVAVGVRERARARLTASPAPTAATGISLALGTRAGGAASPSCSAVRRGINGGRAGSMNIVDLDARAASAASGSSAAASPRRPGRRSRCRGTGRIAVCVLRRRRDEPGVLLRVPELREGARRCRCVFVCENNGYGEYTPMERRHRRRHLRRVPRRWRSRRLEVDGMDVSAVRAAGARGRRARPRRRRPGVRRGAHLPLRRPLAQRPRRATGPRASSTTGASATRSPSPGSGSREQPASRAARLDEVDAAVERELAEAESRALAAPFPEPHLIPEFAG